MTSTSRRVAIIHNTLWSHYKGVIFSELASLLESRGVELLVIQQGITEKMRTGLGTVDMECHRYPLVLLERGSLDEVSWLRRTGRLAIELVRFDPEVVVIPGYADIAYWMALTLCVLAGKQRILAFDSTFADRRRSWGRECAKRFFVAGFDLAFCYGKKAKAYLEWLGVRTEEIRIRCQATANEFIAETHRKASESREERRKQLGLGTKNFIFVGRLSREKNVLALIQAFAEIKKTERNAEDWGLILLGDGPERSRVMEEIETRALGDVRVVGGVAWRLVPEWLALADVLVLPSESEPWGLVVNEAMACGVVPILSRACGAADDLVIDGESGLVVPPRDQGALRDALGLCVNDAELLLRLARRARRVIASYTPRQAAENMASGIVELLA